MRSVVNMLVVAETLLAGASAIQIPSGTELHVRLGSKISSADARAGTTVSAVLIAPVVIDGQIVIPPGAELTGEVKAAQPAAADPQKPPTLELDFKRLAFDAERDAIAA